MAHEPTISLHYLNTLHVYTPRQAHEGGDAIAASLSDLVLSFPKRLRLEPYWLTIRDRGNYKHL